MSLRTVVLSTAVLAVLQVPFVGCKRHAPEAADAAPPADAEPPLAVLDASVPDAAPEDAAVADAALAKLETDAGKPTGLPLPGACVDPMADAKKHATGAGPKVASEPDLDGDGKKDRIFSFAAAPNSPSHPFVVYVMRGTCGHFVGALDAGTLEALPAKARGLSELAGKIPCATKCPCTEKTFTAKFDGKTYLRGMVHEELVKCPGGTGGKAPPAHLAPKK